MPCRSDYEGEDLARTKFELDKVTRLLCELVRTVVNHGAFLSPELTQWWRQHVEIDAKRKAHAEREIKELEARIAMLRKEIAD